MKIVYIFRAKNPLFFSIERVFNLVMDALPIGCEKSVITVPAIGFRISNLTYLFKKAKQAGKHTIFHLTGDIHYCVFVLPRSRTILTIHDCVFLSQHKGWKHWIMKKIYLDWPIKYLRYISTISEKTKREIVELTNCNPEKIQVIPDPVASTIYHLPKTFEKAEPVVLFVGTTPNKNLERVVGALEGMMCKLIIIGKPSVYQTDLLVKAGINYQAFYGLSDEEVADHFAASDIVLFPSLYEGFGLPVIEGFRSGRAVITSDLSPMKEIAGDAACLVEPTNSTSIKLQLTKIIHDDTYRESLIEKGLNRAKEFEVSAIVNKYNLLYKKISQDLCVE